MRLILLAILALIPLFMIDYTSAEVYIPDDEYKAYYNSAGLYTIVGVIKSSEDKPVKPTIHVEIQDDDKIIKKSVEWVPILNAPSLAKEIPFKIIVPEVKSKHAMIKSIDVTYELLDRDSITVMALYDDTLKMYDDHVIGRAVNLGNKTVNNIVMYAVAHAPNGTLLDVAMSNVIDELKPRESKEFVMYIDPIFKGKVGYYSCFGPSDPLVMNLTVTRYNEPFEVFAQGYIWLSEPVFDEDENVLYLNATNNSMPIAYRMSLRIQLSSMDEQLQVYLGDKEADTFQSMEEDGMTWHVSFDYPARSFYPEISIKGFKEPEYKYLKLKTSNENVIVALQIPREVKVNEFNAIKLAFYDTITYDRLRDVDYKIMIDDEVYERNARLGMDTIMHRFSKDVFDIKVDILDARLKGSDDSIKASTEIVTVPEFPISIIIISLAIAASIAFARVKI